MLQTMNDSATIPDIGPQCADCGAPFRQCTCPRHPTREGSIAPKARVEERQAAALEGILSELQAIRAAMGRKSS